MNLLLGVDEFFPLRRSPRMWMKVRSSDFWDRIMCQHFDEDDWHEHMRMSKQTFQWICVQLHEKLVPRLNFLNPREPLSVEKQVAIAIYFLASTCEYRTVGALFGVHKTTVWRCIHCVVDAINTELRETCLKMPDEIECRDISYEYGKKCKIPQIIGSVDGTHIAIKPPMDGHLDYRNRKGWTLIVLQAVVDYNYRFRSINCQAPGSCHDSAVLRQSGLFNSVDRIIPKITRNVNGVKVPYMIIGDPAYPLLPWLMKGYTGQGLPPEKESFNTYLSSARISVEIAFGRLKARWRCIFRKTEVHYTFVPHMIMSCCILHNIVESRKEVFRQRWMQAMRETEREMGLEQPEEEPCRSYDDINASVVRDTLKDYLAANFPLRRSFALS